MKILHEDKDIIVCIKPSYALSERTPDGNGFADLLAKENGGYIGVVHRLDRGVGGVMVYAKTPSSAASLSRLVQQRNMKKEYLAVVHGCPASASGTLTDLLFHDRRKNKTFVVDRVRNGVKEAVLDYTVEKTVRIEPFGAVSLIRISLRTGRTHQIRVQFASRGLPLVGDGKYGASGDRCPIALFSTRLAFSHPVTGKAMEFGALPEGGVWDALLEPSAD